MKKRNLLFDFNVIRSPSIRVERLTGKRAEDFRLLPTRSSMDEKDWTGKTTFYFIRLKICGALSLLLMALKRILKKTPRGNCIKHGKDLLCLRQSIELEKVEQETIDVSARPKELKTPGEPSISERRQHELTHLPYRDWCPLCVKAKGPHGASKKIVDRQPVIAIMLHKGVAIAENSVGM